MYEFSNAPDGQNERQPYRAPYVAPDPRARMARTAMYFAIVALLLCMTGYFSLIFGGVALMIAVLSAHMDGHMEPRARIAVILAGAAIAISLVLIFNAVFNVLLPAMQSPEARAQLNEYYTNAFGFSFDEMLEQFFGETAPVQ